MRRSLYLLGFMFLCSLISACGNEADIQTDGDESESEISSDGDLEDETEDGDATESDFEDGEDETEEDLDDEPIDLSLRLNDGETRVGQISSETELIGGPMAKGKIGDYKLYNSKIQVIIEGTRISDGWGSFGGTIADADIVRAEGEEGESRFSEYFSGFGLRLPDVDQAEIINDGTNGETAHLRLTGPDAELPFVESSLSALLFSTPLDTEMQVDYKLEPDSNLLEIEHSFVWTGDSKIDLTYIVQVFILGDGLQNFMEGAGFNKRLHQGAPPIYITAGKELTYGFFGEDGNLALLFNYEGINFYTTGNAEVKPGQRISFKRYMAVAKGGVDPVMREFNKWVGITEHGTINGTLTDSNDVPIANARIHVTKTVDDEGDYYVSQAITDENGEYSLELTEGDYWVTPYMDGYAMPAALAVSLSNGEIKTEDLEMEAPATVNYLIKDSTDTILPAKLVFDRVEGRIVAPDSFGEMVWQDNHQKVEYTVGQGSLKLLAGTYDVTVSRGYEYSIDLQNITLVAGEEFTLNSVIEHVVDTTGYVSSDFHIHTQASPDSDVYYADRVKSAVADGVEAPIATDHDIIISYDPYVTELGLDDWIHPITGLEVTTYTYGHFNVWPLEVDPTLPNNGAFDWNFKTAPELFEEISQHDTNPLLIVNHPRIASIGGYFSSVKYDAETGETGVPENWSTQFDTIEIINGGGISTALNETLPDWYSFLNRGYRFAGTSGSDNHKLVTEVGLVRNWIASSTDNPAEIDTVELSNNTRNMNVLVSMGPYVEVSINDAQMGEVVTDTSGVSTLKIKVQAPEWMNVDNLQVIANGEVVNDITLDASTADSDNPVIRYNDELTLTPTVDTWYVVIIDGNQNLKPVSRASRAFAFTNPIFIDVDGNGEFNALYE